MGAPLTGLTVADLERLAAATGVEDVPLQMDEEAFRAFYDRTARGLLAYLSRITGHRQLADDLMQEAYYRFLRAARVYENDTHRRNSLYQIATNLARDARRRRVLLQLPEDSDHPAFRAAVDVAGVAERRTDLARAMARLTDRERQMLYLAYGRGESHKDIAAVLGLKAASIRLLLFRARRKLATLLGGGTR
jgi:RNA polymerase sigma-70 factor (ECF subfamily)